MHPRGDFGACHSFLASARARARKAGILPNNFPQTKIRKARVPCIALHISTTDCFLPLLTSFEHEQGAPLCMHVETYDLVLKFINFRMTGALQLRQPLRTRDTRLRAYAIVIWRSQLKAWGRFPLPQYVTARTFVVIVQFLVPSSHPISVTKETRFVYPI
jgi:hypothetical protein